MTYIFQTIGIIGNKNNKQSFTFHKILYFWLKKKGIKVIIESKTANYIKIKKAKTGNLSYIGNRADLAIIIGGDGSMLRAAQILINHKIKIIGINSGTLGFLTDLNVTSTFTQLNNILLGRYINDKRFTLKAKIYKKNKKNKTTKKIAINEIMLHADKTAHMIEFEVYIDNKFTFAQRSDGLIISTPTGSTAYALSAGGPIISPKVDAILLISILPHILSSRPLIINSNSKITLKFSDKNSSKLKMSYDNNKTFLIHKEETILIYRGTKHLNLIHPNNFNFFKTLDIKLGWSKKLF